MCDVLNSDLNKLGLTLSVNPKDLSCQEIVDFIKMCFEIPKEQGIVYSAIDITTSHVEDVLNNGILWLVRDSTKIVACSLTFIQKCGFMFCDKRMYIHITCVHPQYLRRGISKCLIRQIVEFARNEKCKYVYRSTALNSPINVPKCIKDGFYKWRINSYEGTDYYSILFRKDFKKTSLLMKIWQKFRFAYSCVWCKMCKNADGSYTIIGTVIEKPLLFVRNTIINILKKIKK